MKDDLLLKLLKTPALAGQVRKYLVNRDVSIKIDGKEYQIMQRQAAAEDELTKLKAEVWDLRQELSKLTSALFKFTNNEIGITEVREAAGRARDILGEP